MRAQCRHLMALGLLPINEVDKQFQRIRTLASAALEDLFTYFNRQWMKGSVPREMWNFNNFEHRTNNVCECMCMLAEPLNMIEISTCLLSLISSLQLKILFTFIEGPSEHLDIYSINQIRTRSIRTYSGSTGRWSIGAKTVSHDEGLSKQIPHSQRKIRGQTNQCQGAVSRSLFTHWKEKDVIF